MSRHQRIRSDFAGLKSVFTTRHRNLEEVSQVNRANRSFTNFLPKKFTKPQPNENNMIAPPSQKQEVHQLMTDAHLLLDYFYKDESSAYYVLMEKYLNGDWQSNRKKIKSHLNKLKYMQESMQKLSYMQIEGELIREWRHNPVLYSTRSLWYKFMVELRIKELQHFLVHYHRFKEFIAQITYLFFKLFFTNLEKRGDAGVLEKLTERTSHFIITHTETWNKIFDKLLAPLVLRQMQPVNHSILTSFDLNTLELSEFILDLSSSNNTMPSTASNILEFLQEHKIWEQIPLLIKIRNGLYEEIRSYQSKLIDQSIIDQYKILDKDDIIGSLIYTIVRGKIDFQMIGAIVKSYHYLMGDETSAILSKFECESYLTDLQAVHEFLHMWAVQQLAKDQNCHSPERNRSTKLSKTVQTANSINLDMISIGLSHQSETQLLNSTMITPERKQTYNMKCINSQYYFENQMLHPKQICSAVLIKKNKQKLYSKEDIRDTNSIKKMQGAHEGIDDEKTPLPQTLFRIDSQSVELNEEKGYACQ